MDKIISLSSLEKFWENVQNYITFDISNKLEFFCIEPVSIIVNGQQKDFVQNSNISLTLQDGDEFEIITTSNKSISILKSWPGVLSVFYDWLEGVNMFSNIVFDMNTEAMYMKWSQYNQGVYHVQQAQYTNCIFWSDLPFKLTMSERNNYTLNRSTQLPLCFSTIPENTYKPFYCCYSVVSDPNLNNKAYLDSFAATTTNTSPWSYYGIINLGSFDDMEHNIIPLPSDCRGLMYYSPSIITAGIFDATNVTDFGASGAGWRQAFGECTSLHTLLIRNLKVSINLSWSPITQESLNFILSNAANTSAITISLSPKTYYELTDTNKGLATNKNITLTLVESNAHQDSRLAMLINSGDGTKYLKDDGTYDYVYVFERLYTEYAYECLQQGITAMSYEQFLTRMMTNLSIQTPTTTSQLTNNSGFITANDIPDIPTKTSELTNDSNFVDNSVTDALSSSVDTLKFDKNSKVLWIGTSIPAGDITHGNNGTTQSITTDLGSNNYPKMVADALGFTLYNNARGSSFVCFYPPEEDGTNAWAGASDWTEYQNETWKGFSLAASMAQVDEKFGPNGLNCPEWLINQFKSYSYESLIIPYIDGTLASCDTVVIDHGYNDRAVIINQASWYPGDGETQFAAGAGRSWLKTLQDPFEQTLTTEGFFQSAWWNDESVNSKKHYFNAVIFICKKIWAVNPRIKIIIGNYFAKKSNVFGAEFGNDKLGEFVCLANSAIANWLQVKCVNVADQTGLYNRNLAAGNDYSLFCPDGVHPHTDSTGKSNKVIAGVYINELRGLLYN